MWRIALCLVAFVIVGDAFAQSQRPSQRGREPGQGQRQGQTQTSPAQQPPAAANPQPQATNPPAAEPQSQPAAQPPITVNVLPTPKTEAERAEEANERQEKAERDRQMVKFTTGLYYATIGLAAATIFLVIAITGLGVFALVQSRHLKASIAAAAKAKLASDQSAVATSQQQFRAYVTARDLNLVVHRDPPPMAAQGDQKEGLINTYGFAAILKNGGQTPATQLEVNVSCRKFHTIPDDFNFPDSNLFGHGVIGPLAELQTPIIRIAASEFDSAEAPGNWWFWGWVEYGDIFSGTQRHRTEFCFAIDRRRLPGRTELWIGFNPHSRFNAVDGDCLRPIYPTNTKTADDHQPRDG
jgi:hypothetical protein